MNKQELIEKLKTIDGGYGSRYYIAMGDVCELVEQLDEPQKVQVPQFVADWYEEYKDDFEYNVWDWISSKDEPEKIQSEFAFWVNDVENNPIQTLVNMHQFGYDIKKERRYTVKMRTTNQPLFYNSLEKKLFFSLGELAAQFTFKQLEEAGFGEVFNSPLFEVEEVEE